MEHERFGQPLAHSNPDSQSQHRRTLIAWAITLLTVGVVVLLTVFSGQADVVGPQMAGAVGEFNGKYVFGMGALSPMSKDQALIGVSFETGTINERLRNVVLVADLKDAEAARKTLGKIKEVMDEEVIEAERLDRDCYVTEADKKAFAVLEKLYDQEWTPADSVKALSEEDRADLRDSLGWHGELALAPEGLDDDSARQTLTRSAQVVFFGTLIGAFLAIGAGFIGLVGLVMLIVSISNGSLSPRLSDGLVRPNLYIETFAIWLVLCFGGQIIGGVLGLFLPEDFRMLPLLFVFFGSLVALVWPMFWGAKLNEVRKDIGWSLPKPVWATPFYGVAGYLMGLPIFVLGIVCTVVITMILAAFESSHELAPVSGPAHPIVTELTGNPLVVLQVFLLASVAAPIVEETMFRGVLYRHLRELSRTRKWWISVVFSTLLNAFLFAAIHPQGLAAIPALMGLAIAFTIAREVLDSTVPSMIMHGISNGITLTLSLFLFG